MWRALSARGVLGMNRRNARYIGPLNRDAPIPRGQQAVDPPARRRLRYPHPALYGAIETAGSFGPAGPGGPTPAFVVKPARGAAGNGSS